MQKTEKLSLGFAIKERLQVFLNHLLVLGQLNFAYLWEILLFLMGFGLERFAVRRKK